MKGKILQERIYRLICDNWPVHVREIAVLLNLDPMNITNISKIRYHFKVLEKRGKIRTKNIGKALVAWPDDMEKMRVIHELLRVE